LAEGDEPESNILSQNFARFRNSYRLGAFFLRTFRSSKWMAMRPLVLWCWRRAGRSGRSRSAPQPPFGLPAVLVVVRASRV